MFDVMNVVEYVLINQITLTLVYVVLYIYVDKRRVQNYTMQFIPVRFKLL